VHDTLGYVRVSTEQQATEQKTSLTDQRRLIVDKARAMGRVLEAAAIFEDAGVSGATAEGRPAFMAMLRYCESNPRPAKAIGMIFVLNDSRFGRFDDPEEATHWRFVLKRLGWRVRFVEGDEVEDTFARGVIRFIGSAQASEYRANLKRTAKRAARSTAEKGLWQQEAPLGYRRLATRTDGAQRVLEIGQRKADDEVSRLTLGPEEEVEAIRTMFDGYANRHLSLGMLMTDMVSRFPFRAWSRQTVRMTLKNPAYMGDVVWCRRVTDPVERLTQTVRDRSEWVVVRDAHPAIVSRELYQAVQDRMASNKRQTTATRGGYPLAGLIRCAQCGMHFAGGGGKKGPASDPDRFRFYKDTGSSTRIPVCPPPITTLRKRWLEAVVIDAVADMVADPLTQKTIREEVQAQMSTARDSEKDRRASLERDRDRLIDQRRRLVNAVASGALKDSEAATNLAELRTRIAGSDAEIERLRFAVRAQLPDREEIQRMVRLAQDFPVQVRRLTGVALREALRPWIANAVVDKEKRVLTLTMWRVPGAAQVFRLNNVAERGAQENTLRRKLTVRRRIQLPARPGGTKEFYARRRAAGGSR
jgi:DNA invertase Pin-like site-specific DNA recombinase